MGIKYVAAIDQGTTSTRCILMDEYGQQHAVAQRPHEQILPREGWIEHDPMEIWHNVRSVMSDAMVDVDAAAADIISVGITNQRETAVVWDKTTGRPIYNAIVWQDTRTGDVTGEDSARWLKKTGLLANSYPAGPKIAWILDNVEGAREKAEEGSLLAGTIDSWLIWNLTGGARGNKNEPALHVTDITNASRTLLMDLHTGQWDEELCEELRVPRAMLPEIKASISSFGTIRTRGPMANAPITAVLGDQHAALFGQGCFAPGEAKNTYGTGLFMLLNTGDTPHFSERGLLTTIAWQCEGEPAVYALEGSVAVGGSLIQWLRDQMGILRTAGESETLGSQVEDSGGVYIVPAFSGLFAPYWRADARGVIVGLTRYTDKRHIARAALEATAWQTRDVVEAMVADSGVALERLRVDGGMTSNDLLMKIQADALGISVERPSNIETTVMGAAYASAFGAGVFESLEEVKKLTTADSTWERRSDKELIDASFSRWHQAVERSYGWA